jgi:hypothetical protein
MTCPDGHESTDLDHCSVCGAKMEGPVVVAAPSPSHSTAPSIPLGPVAAPAAPLGSGSGPAVGSASPGIGAGVAEACPNCQAELEPGSRFCEVCGYDPSTGSLPKAPVPQPADPPASTAGGQAAAGSGAGAGATGPSAAGTWVAVVTADRPYYDRNQVAEVQFPLGVPARVIELAAGEAVAIGRRSHSRGTNPAIDLAGPPEDAAVSHTHASLLPQDDGTWSLVDHGSTNGTYLNESTTPVPPNTPTPVTPTDRIYVGAWTRITLEVR